MVQHKNVISIADRRATVVAIDSCAGRFSESANGAGASFGGGACSGEGAKTDTARVTPLERWDVDSTAAAVSHKPGSRFGRYARAHS